MRWPIKIYILLFNIPSLTFFINTMTCRLYTVYGAWTVLSRITEQVLIYSCSKLKEAISSQYTYKIVPLVKSVPEKGLNNSVFWNRLIYNLYFLSLLHSRENNSTSRWSSSKDIKLRWPTNSILIFDK